MLPTMMTLMKSLINIFCISFIFFDIANTKYNNSHKCFFKKIEKQKEKKKKWKQ